MNPIISVIIPVYNKENYLEKTLKSVISQTFENFEIVIIDDGSTDKSYDIAYNFSKHDTRIRVFKQENSGVSKTRNKALDFAVGKYVTFLDADDKYDTKFLEKMLSQIGDGNAIYCGSFNVRGNEIKKVKNSFEEGDIFYKYLKHKCHPNMNSWLIKKEFLERYNIKFQENLTIGEDVVFFSNIMFFERNIKVCKEHLTFYNVEVESSLSKVNKDKNIEKNILWIQSLELYFEQFQNKKELQSRIKRAKKILNGYRMPAAIIYEINSKSLSKEMTSETLSLYKKYIKKINLVNGFRSIKLYLVYWKLKKW
ncbi:MAG: glycosyltransferase family 2 protein [Caryophanon sp.]|nr:glycosyltransferase family 2 protein [Caryophanon sp.]